MEPNGNAPLEWSKVVTCATNLVPMAKKVTDLFAMVSAQEIQLRVVHSV